MSLLISIGHIVCLLVIYQCTTALFKRWCIVRQEDNVVMEWCWSEEEATKRSNALGYTHPSNYQNYTVEKR